MVILYGFSCLGVKSQFFSCVFVVLLYSNRLKPVNVLSQQPITKDLE